MKTLLAVDVGGTKAELALFDLYGRDLAPVQRAISPCAGHAGIEEIIAAFLYDTRAEPEYACLGVAGIVRDGTARITNLPWLMVEETLAGKFSLSGVKLINAMTALCAALPSFAPSDLRTLQKLSLIHISEPTRRS
jgi:glucokinase